MPLLSFDYNNINEFYLNTLERDFERLKTFEFHFNSLSSDFGSLQEKIDLLYHSISSHQQLLDSFGNIIHTFGSSVNQSYFDEVDEINSKIADLLEKCKSQKNNILFLLQVKNLINRRKELLSSVFKKIKRKLRYLKIQVSFFGKYFWKISFRKIIRQLIKNLASNSIDEDSALKYFQLKGNYFKSMYQLIFLQNGPKRQRVYYREDRRDIKFNFI